ncbi:MAG: response regulator, partial [Planctomycetes bacterium]|nr:response regulator [Planctomycetota bacterium]
TNRITALLAASDGALCIGTEDQRAFRYANGRFEPIELGSDPLVTQIGESADGSIWIAGRGVTQWRAGSSRWYDLDVDQDFAEALYPLGPDSVWVESVSAQHVLAGGVSTLQSGAPVIAILRAPDDRLWTLLESPGSAPFGSALIVEHAEVGKINRAFADSHGQVWIASTKGLFRQRQPLEPSTRSITPVSALALDRPTSCRSVFEDREGNLWAGWEQLGVCRLRPSTTTRVFETGGTVIALASDGDGGVAFSGTAPGLTAMASDLSLKEIEPPDPETPRVRQLLRDSNGHLWSRRNDRVSRQGGGADDSWMLSTSCIAEDPRGTVWAAANGELFELDGQPPTRHVLADAGQAQSIESLVFDADGAAWFTCSRSREICRWADGALERHRLPADIAGVAIRHLASDGEGRIWISTYGAGLGRLQNGEVRLVDSAAGLLDDSLGHIFVVDDRLWLNSNRGAFTVRLTDLDRWFDVDPTEPLTCYQACDTEGNGAEGFRAADGTLWLPTVNGLINIEPTLQLRLAAPPVLIEGIVANSTRLVPNGDEILGIQPGDGSLEVSYTGLSFAAPKRVRFRYRLQPASTEAVARWVEAGNRRTAYFTNLDPGDYEFHVTACNSEGTWSSQPATVRLAFEPHFYQTGWFKLLLACLTTMVIAGIHLVRTSTVRRRNRQLNAEIEAHHHTEAVLREREATHRALAETATDGILIVDGSLRIEYANTAARSMFGDEGPHLESLPLTSVLVDDDAGPNTVEELFEGDGRRALPLRGRRGEGNFPIEVSSGSMLRSDGKTAFVLILRDVTTRRRLEQQLAEARKLEAVGRLTGGIAHDFNNILTALLCQAAILDDDLDGGRDTNTAKMSVDQIRRSAERAARLVRQLLTFARQRVIEPRLIDPNETITELQPMLRSIVPAIVDLQLDLAPKVGLVFVDPHELEQVLVNLVVNARDAIENKGTVRIATNRVRVESSRDEDLPPESANAHVAISIADDGRGMQTEEQERAFDPFYTTKPTGSGTGLGLASAYGFAKQAGGRIEVESAPGEGATFTIYLPVVRSLEPLPPLPSLDRRPSAASPRPDHPPASGPSPSPPSGHGTILICDDDHSVLQTVALILRSRGYEVLTAPRPDVALQLFTEHRGRIRMLVTDIVMPIMDGRELAGEIRQVEPELPVLFMSGYTPSALRSSEDDPRSDFLNKPFAPNDLEDRVAVLFCSRSG